VEKGRKWRFEVKIETAPNQLNTGTQAGFHQPHPQGPPPVQNGGRRNPRPRLPEWLQKFVRTSSHKHDEMSSFCLNNGFRLQKTKRTARRWKQPPKKPFHHVYRDKTLHDSWSVSAAPARGPSNRHPERGEGPGDEVEQQQQCPLIIIKSAKFYRRILI